MKLYSHIVGFLILAFVLFENVDVSNSPMPNHEVSINVSKINHQDIQGIITNVTSKLETLGATSIQVLENEGSIKLSYYLTSSDIGVVQQFLISDYTKLHIEAITSKNKNPINSSNSTRFVELKPQANRLSTSKISGVFPLANKDELLLNLDSRQFISSRYYDILLNVALTHPQVRAGPNC